MHERNGWPGSGIWGLASGREVGTLGAVWSSRMEVGADSRRLLQAEGAGADLAGVKAVQNPSKSDGIQVNPTKKVPAYGHQMTNGAGGRCPDASTARLQAKAPGDWRTPRRWRVGQAQTRLSG
jgi:hypothetical protein